MGEDEPKSEPKEVVKEDVKEAVKEALKVCPNMGKSGLFTCFWGEVRKIVCMQRIRRCTAAAVAAACAPTDPQVLLNRALQQSLLYFAMVVLQTREVRNALKITWKLVCSSYKQLLESCSTNVPADVNSRSTQHTPCYFVSRDGIMIM